MAMTLYRATCSEFMRRWSLEAEETWSNVNAPFGAHIWTAIEHNAYNSPLLRILPNEVLAKVFANIIDDGPQSSTVFLGNLDYNYRRCARLLSTVCVKFYNVFAGELFATRATQACFKAVVYHRRGLVGLQYARDLGSTHPAYLWNAQKVILQISAENLSEIPVAVNEAKVYLRKMRKVGWVQLVLESDDDRAEKLVSTRVRAGPMGSKEMSEEHERKLVALEAQTVWMVWSLAIEKRRSIEIEAGDF